MEGWKIRGDRVLIKPDPAEKKTEKGILLPHNETYPQGVLVGKGSKCLEEDLKEGDRVMYGTNAGVEVRIDGGDQVFLMMREFEIYMSR